MTKFSTHTRGEGRAYRRQPLPIPAFLNLSETLQLCPHLLIENDEIRHGNKSREEAYLGLMFQQPTEGWLH